MTGGYRVGVDIGGTFTDIVLLAPDGTCVTRKVLSTPDDYARGIVDGLGDLLRTGGHEPADCREVVHGTTVATNAILENRGAKTALLTTRGFRDVLELRRLRTPTLYNLRFRPPPPMVERRLRLEVTERMGPHGEVLEPLEEGSVRRAIERIRAEGVEAVAVTLLHSYINPEHEARVGELVRRELPEVFLSVSTEILPEIREYERTSTTVINAYVGPIVRSYLASLDSRLRSAGIDAPITIMRSSGGTMSTRAAAIRPAHIVESGPAAGTIAARATGEELGMRDLIAFDMGGTTAKATLIEDGAVNLTAEYEVGAGISLSSRLVKGGGHALRLPVLDIAEVGAGGGSIVSVDRGGSLKVGPRSAGASPGPACYGLGGEDATVTDANLVLGYLNPCQLAGGALPLHAGLAHAAIERVAERIGTAPEDAAFGVYTVANATMIRAIKAVTTYRGRDPRDFTLLAFGGGGPLHAVALARELGIGRVVVPRAPGLFSAFGLLRAPIEEHAVQTYLRRLADADPEELTAAYRALEARARQALKGDGHDLESLRLRRHADLRYVGQAYELTVPAEGEALDVPALGERFEAEHERVYGHRAQHEPVELVNLRVTATVPAMDGQALRMERREIAGGERRVWFGEEWVRVPVVSRSIPSPPDPLSHAGRGGDGTGRRRPAGAITSGTALEDGSLLGPLIVEDYDSTTVVPAGCRASLCGPGCILIEVG